ncbi:MAG: radical SAM protein [Gemmatimonadaceae bacterium]|jgi:hypothetical protein|nr:radical SAM protein [Gemmatimonadaceae bacterium]
MGSIARLRELLTHVVRPVRDDTRRQLAQSWAALPPALRTPHQMLGRQGNGCGATIGAMPRCDFACRGCYLGEEANRIPAASVEEIKAQMRLLRPVLGHAGNLQLTDGEVTLRPESELIELLRYARELELVPMLMTHGDTFRRRPGLLERLMTEGGLTEVSIHVDTTQRGRKGARWRDAAAERDLNPLRDEFAELARAAKRATGLPLRCATTMTVTRENLPGVADVLRWLVQNADVFHLISFQPIAQVGRTEDGFGGGVTADALWEEVARALGNGTSAGAARVARGAKWLGHSACNRFVHGIVSRRDSGAVSFHPIRESGDVMDEAVVDGFLSRFGGITFRVGTRADTMAKLAGVMVTAPAFVARHLIPYVAHWARRLDDGAPWRAAWDVSRGATRLHGLAIVSHHFMSRDELESPLGQERVAQCVFHVPIDGALVSMCEVNALGRREQLYARLARGGATAETDASAGAATAVTVGA